MLLSGMALKGGKDEEELAPVETKHEFAFNSS